MKEMNQDNWLTGRPSVIPHPPPLNIKVKIERRADVLLARAEAQFKESKAKVATAKALKIPNREEIELAAAKSELAFKAMKKLYAEIEHAKDELRKAENAMEMTRCRKRVAWLHDRMHKTVVVQQSLNEKNYNESQPNIDTFFGKANKSDKINRITDKPLGSFLGKMKLSQKEVNLPMVFGREGPESLITDDAQYKTDTKTSEISDFELREQIIENESYPLDSLLRDESNISNDQEGKYEYSDENLEERGSIDNNELSNTDDDNKTDIRKKVEFKGDSFSGGKSGKLSPTGSLESYPDHPVFSIAGTSIFDDEILNIVDKSEIESEKTGEIEEESNHDAASLYWEREHNRLEIGEQAVLDQDPTSYHAMAIAVSGTFLTKKPEEPKPLPWNSKNDSNVHRLGIEKFQQKLFRLQNAVFDAAGESIPRTAFTPKVERILANERDSSSVMEIKNNKFTGDQRLGTSFSGRLVYYPAPLTPPAILPTTRLSAGVIVPTKPSKYSFSTPDKVPSAQGVAEQHNLKDETKLTLFKARPVLTMEKTSESIPIKQNLMYRLTLDSRDSWAKMKPRSGVLVHSGIKWERVKDLVGRGLLSEREEERIDAARNLGILNCADTTVIGALRKRLEEDKSERVRFESCVSLIKAGAWDEKLMESATDFLALGNSDMRMHILKSLNISPRLKLMPNRHFIQVLIHLTKRPNKNLAFMASIILGKLGNSEAEPILFELLKEDDVNHNLRAQALEVLIKDLGETDKIVIDAVLNQLLHSPSWKERKSACRLLSSLGITFLPLEKTYNVLEQKLWDEPSKLVRKECAETLTSLGLLARAALNTEKKLEDKTAEGRAQAVIAVGTLGMHTNRILRMLLEMLELDSSEHVRVLVIRTLVSLGARESQVIRALNDKHSKGDGILSKEASKALMQLSSSASA
ncbi:DgyrCDS10577 [Dimorphilus gyrociliatus]|uniref:DgyrCDS10577 n=1 Tax=Dimorphilus gyrociliatus TaxID=2664684 RepID=A0A7I8W0M7_9ANNE|nr:DgyrCDS10577 [Dimorphilus gyrociliatus]